MFRQGSLKVELEDAQVTTDVFFLLDTSVFYSDTDRPLVL